MRRNFFPNTHDILPHILQFGGRPAFRMRFVLAATLSCTYGIYSGFELCENTPRGDPAPPCITRTPRCTRYKVRDWDSPGNIKEYIARINEIRRENRALQYRNLSSTRPRTSTSSSTANETGDNAVFVAVNLDPYERPRNARAVPAGEPWDRGGRGLRGPGAHDGEGRFRPREAGPGSGSTRGATRRRSSASGGWCAR